MTTASPLTEVPAAREAHPAPSAQLRWAPAVVAALVVGAITVAFGVPVADVLRFAAYYALTVVLPGVLLWRAVGIRPVSFVEEVVAGTVTGLVVQVLLRWLLAPADLQAAAVLWAPLVVLLCVVTPLRRRAWRTAATDRASVAGAWVLAGASVAALWWLASTSFRVNQVAPVPGFRGQFYAVAPYVDMSFQQALAAEAAGPWPREYPYVPDVPLRYTTMVYEHLADATRWSGVDLTLVTMRLHLVPLLVLAVLLCGALAHRLSGIRWASPLGAVLGVLTAPPALYVVDLNAFSQIATLNLGTLRSPTQTFGEPIFLLLLLLACVVLGSDRGEVRTAAVLMLPVAFVAGAAKATFLPLVVCGAVLALVLGRSRRVRSLVVLGVALVAFLAATLLVTGSGSRDLRVGDGRQLISFLPFVPVLGDLADPRVFAVSLVIVVAAWSLAGLGAVLLLRRAATDARFWFLVGVAVAGMSAAILGQHSGLSQAYFLRSAWPVLGVLSAWGLAVAVRTRARSSRRAAVVTAGLLGLGVVAVWVARQVPAWAAGVTGPGWSGLVAVLRPWAVAGGVVVLLALALQATTARRQGVRWDLRLVGVCVVGMLVGTSLSASALGGSLAPREPSDGAGPDGPAVAADVASAARWIRGASDADDVVATNAHCAYGSLDDATCDARHFWVAALTERSVLVEGWEYADPPETVVPGGFQRGDAFWRQDLLALSDEVVSDPTAEAVSELVSHGVGWILVDRGVERESDDLGRVAERVFEAPGAAVYRLDG